MTPTPERFVERGAHAIANEEADLDHGEDFDQSEDTDTSVEARGQEVYLSLGLGV